MFCCQQRLPTEAERANNLGSKSQGESPQIMKAGSSEFRAPHLAAHGTEGKEGRANTLNFLVYLEPRLKEGGKRVVVICQAALPVEQDTAGARQQGEMYVVPTALLKLLFELGGHPSMGVGRNNFKGVIFGQPGAGKDMIKLSGIILIDISFSFLKKTPGQENTKAQPKQEEGESEAMEVWDAGEVAPEIALGGWAGESRKEEEELVEVVKEDPGLGNGCILKQTPVQNEGQHVTDFQRDVESVAWNAK
ncbi:hypothetical protein JRQ81_017430 [Phrynocephalus forsythii]|uniref:Uncharacterized protein n=1 Tax=Phrynocephalus forsythii TaxID=171643 RepID=A0A9Q0XSS5_9SAUR|nr:hypothetical protein JRQ81_017430 [Phrynocephalus forsythii]